VDRKKRNSYKSLLSRTIFRQNPSLSSPELKKIGSAKCWSKFLSWIKRLLPRSNPPSEYHVVWGLNQKGEDVVEDVPTASLVLGELKGLGVVERVGLVVDLERNREH